MKFTKRILQEAFDYSQWALNDAEDIADKLTNFLADVSEIKNRDNYLTLEDEYKLQEARDILSKFVVAYSKYARSQAEARYKDN